MITKHKISDTIQTTQYKIRILGFFFSFSLLPLPYRFHSLSPPTLQQTLLLSPATGDRRLFTISVFVYNPRSPPSSDYHQHPSPQICIQHHNHHHRSNFFSDPFITNRHHFHHHRYHHRRLCSTGNHLLLLRYSLTASSIATAAS